MHLSSCARAITARTAASQINVYTTLRARESRALVRPRAMNKSSSGLSHVVTHFKNFNLRILFASNEGLTKSDKRFDCGAFNFNIFGVRCCTQYLKLTSNASHAKWLCRLDNLSSAQSIPYFTF